MTDVKRVQYFDHQFLRLADFVDEQSYLRRLRRVHNATLHTSGIASGLDVTIDQGSSHVTVSAGTAIDADGQDIVLDSAFQCELGGLPADADAFVAISWREQSTDPSPDGGGDTRWTEAPKIEGMPSAPTDGQHLVLAKVKRSGTTVQPNPDTSMRRAAGVVSGDMSVNSLRVRVPNAVQSAWPALTAPSASSARLDGGLTVTGALTSSGPFSAAAISGASLQLSGALAVDTSNGNGGAKDPGLTFGSASGEGIASTRQAGTNRFGLDFFTNAQARMSIDNAGHVGIGIRAPQAALDVQGGDVRWGASRLVLDQGGSIELGGAMGVAGVGAPYIDFHFAGLTQDFNVRLQNDRDGHLAISGGLSVAGNLDLAADLSLQPNHIISGAGRLHVSCAELLYILNKNGVIIGKEWGGNGNLSVQGDTTVGGNIGTAGRDPRVGLPTGWGGGVHTFDVYAEATIAAGPAGGPPKAWINSAGQVAGVTKPFIIDHPEDPEHRDLVHATLEGPEHAVIYRGEGKLSDGSATVTLPSYFEALTRVEGRTVVVTPRLGPGGRIATVGASEVRQGSFTVRGGSDADATAGFWWQVIAVRADVDVLEDEPLKTGSRLAAEEPAASTRKAPAKKAAAKRAPARRKAAAKK